MSQAVWYQAGKQYLGGGDLLQACNDGRAGAAACCPVDVGRQAKQGRIISVWQGIHNGHVACSIW